MIKSAAGAASYLIRAGQPAPAILEDWYAGHHHGAGLARSDPAAVRRVMFSMTRITAGSAPTASARFLAAGASDHHVARPHTPPVSNPCVTRLQIAHERHPPADRPTMSAYGVSSRLPWGSNVKHSSHPHRLPALVSGLHTHPDPLNQAA